MVVLLSLVMVAALGTWIPLVQTVSGVPQRTRTLYVTAGNVLFAGVALAVTGGQLAWGWRGFWLPTLGGVVWTAGNYCAFRASESIGLARAAGSWTPLNIIVAFVWGAAAFGELDGFSVTRLALLGGALVLVMGGVLVIVRSQDGSAQTLSPVSAEAGPRPRGLMWAVAAGVLWGSYFVPAQWAGTSAQVSNFPLAVGMLAGGVALVLPGGAPVRLHATAVTPLLAAGMVFGIGNLALLGLVSRVGTGVGFTIAQLSLLVNASIGIWLFKVPAPGSRAAKLTVAGILIAGSGGAIIGAMR
jgi:glucose uptake protein GlcU